MKQYRFKKDFGYCLSGTISKYHEDMNVYGFKFLDTKKCKRGYVFDIEEIRLLIKQGYLEECKELKWTDEDMIEFAGFVCYKFYDDVCVYKNEDLKNKLKEYEKIRQTKNI